MNEIKSTQITGFEIAVIGMSGRFPGAGNCDEFWENLIQGKESVSFFTHEELKEAGISEELIQNPNYVKASGVLEDKEFFDTFFFGYSSKEAGIMSPQLRILHEICWEALEHAGYDPTSYEGLIGLYAGAASNFYWRCGVILSGQSNLLGEFATIHLIDNQFLCTKISHKLDLKGPGYFLDTACSTSLTAIHVASRALLAGECDIALAGGVSLSFLDGYGHVYQEGMIHSPDGHCRAFDAQAKGFFTGEGAGIVVLKTLEDALEDRDHIQALIKGTAINNDGDRKAGYSAPSIHGQAEVIRACQRLAEVEPGTIGYIETHGTGTPLGDLVEFEALKLAFNGTGKKQFCSIGSVKTNVGHLDQAAGVTAFIKTLLVLKHKLIPPSLHFQTPNPKIDFENSPFYVNTQLKEWKTDGNPLRAAVSSFGQGGTNAHAILEEPPVMGPSSPGMRKTCPYHLILLSAKTETALEKITHNLVKNLKNNPGINLADAVYTLQVGRKRFPYGKMAVGTDVKEIIKTLSGLGSRKARTFLAKEENKPVVFLFPGLGAQYVNMGRELYRQHTLFRQETDRCFEILRSLVEYDIKEILYPGLTHPPHTSSSPLESGVPKGRGVSNPDINRFEVAQLLVFIIEYALAKLLIHWGIKPRAMMGYSFGEYAAACISGVFSLEDALKLIVLRGQLIQKQPAGAMSGIPLSSEELTPLLASFPRLAIAIDNGLSCVISGPGDAVDALERQLKEKKLICMPVSQASRALHSQMMEPVLKKFTEKVRQISLNKPKIPYISNVTGEFITVEAAIDPTYWAKHLRETVQFASGIRKILEQETPVFVEIGPGQELSVLLARHLENKPECHVMNLIPPSHSKIPGLKYFLSKIGQLWLYGIPIDWSEFYSQEKRYRISLPTYPFERQRYRATFHFREMLANMSGSGTFPPKKSDIADWFYIPAWEQSTLYPYPPVESQKPCNWLLFAADDCQLGAQMIQQLHRYGHFVIRVGIGTRYRKVDDGTYRVNPQQEEDYKALFQDLRKNDEIPDKICHLWNVTRNNHLEPGIKGLDWSQDIGLYSLLSIVRVLGREEITKKIQMIVVTNEMQEVTGEENIDPRKATILGAVKVIPLEYTNIKCRSIDIIEPESNSPREAELVEQLLAECLTGTQENVAAYRGTYRWTPIFKLRRLDKTGAAIQRFREKGVYLVTGGLGGMGFTLAEYLAKTYKARLVLVGRSPFPGKEQWPGWLERHKHDPKNPISLKIRKVQEWENLGAEVIIASADVSHLQQMRDVVNRAVRQWGSINGLLHTAGVIDYAGAILKRTRDMTEEVMAPKVKGTLVLETLFKHMDLEFMVFFSSVGNIIYGSKFGQVGYSAANDFLDAYAYYMKSKGNTFIVSINWIDWLEKGMAVKAIDNARQGDKENIDYESILIDALSPPEGVEVFVRVMGYPFHRIAMSTRDLNFLAAYYNTPRQEKRDPLPEPGKETRPEEQLYQRPELSTQYAPARNHTEQVLIDIFQNFFGTAELGIDDDFFELGGDSLKAITVIAKIHQKLHVEVPIERFFNHSTVKELAEYVNRVETGVYSSIQPVEKKEHYPLSSAQERFYILQDMEPESTAYNNPYVMLLEGSLVKEKLEESFKILIRRHENLRASFEVINDELVQRVHEDNDFDIEYVELPEIEARPIVAAFKKPFDLSETPLFRTGLIRIDEGKHIFMLDMHHIITDLTSINIFAQEIMSIYSGYEFPPLRLQYKDFCQWQHHRLVSGKLKKQEQYWIEQFSGELPVLNMPTDYPRPAIQSFDGEVISFYFDKELTRKLNNLMRETGTTLYMVILALYNIILSRYTEQEDIIIGSPTAGRKHADLENIIGLLIETFAIRSYPTPKKTFKEFLEEIRENTLKAYENQEYPFRELLKQVVTQVDGSRNPLFDAMLMVQNVQNVNVDAGSAETAAEELKIAPYHQDIYKVSKVDLTLEVIERNTELLFNLEYCTKLFKKETMETFITYFKEIASAIPDNRDIKLRDIHISLEVRVADSTIYQDEESRFDF